MSVSPGWIQTGTFSVGCNAGPLSQLTCYRNFLNFGLGAVGGVKFNDLNGDGSYDPAVEPGLAGWTIDLYQTANGITSLPP